MSGPTHTVAQRTAARANVERGSPLRIETKGETVMNPAPFRQIRRAPDAASGGLQGSLDPKRTPSLSDAGVWRSCRRLRQYNRAGAEPKRSRGCGCGLCHKDLPKHTKCACFPRNHDSRPFSAHISQASDT